MGGLDGDAGALGDAVGGEGGEAFVDEASGEGVEEKVFTFAGAGVLDGEGLVVGDAGGFFLDGEDGGDGLHFGAGRAISAQAVGDGVDELGGEGHFAAAPDGDLAFVVFWRGFDGGDVLVETDEGEVSAREDEGGADF